MADITIELQGEHLRLLPERLLFWERWRTLVLADAHFGKAATFRARSIPVPGGTTQAALQRLEAAIQRTQPERLICLGDLLHARDGRVSMTMTAVAAWRTRHAQLDFVLVRGNHDQHAGDPPAAWRVCCVDEPWAERPFVWRHFPAPEAEGYTLAGHLHPAVRLAGRGGLQVTLPCFYLGDTVGVLPAFGDFTGTATIHPRQGERVYVIADEEIMLK